MDDDRKKFPRKNGPKPAGPRRTDGAPRGGKPAFAGKPRTEGGKKPYVKRTPDAGAAASGERPKRDFKRDDRPTGRGRERGGRRAKAVPQGTAARRRAQAVRQTEARR